MGGKRGTILKLYYGNRIRARLSAKNPFRILKFEHFGRPLRVELTSDYLGAFLGVFLDQEYHCNDHLPQGPKRIIDLGANIGMATLSLSAQFPGSEFVCVEPDARNVSVMKRNLLSSAVEGKIFEAAVGPEKGRMTLGYGKDPTCSALSITEMHGHVLETEVEVITMSEILERSGWDHVDLLKIDIEGSEEDLLGRNNEWLRKVSCIILEIHPNTTLTRISDHLAGFGFEFRAKAKSREPVYVFSRTQPIPPQLKTTHT